MAERSGDTAFARSAGFQPAVSQASSLQTLKHPGCLECEITSVLAPAFWSTACGRPQGPLPLFHFFASYVLRVPSRENSSSLFNCGGRLRDQTFQNDFRSPANQQRRRHDYHYKQQVQLETPQLSLAALNSHSPLLRQLRFWRAAASN